MYHETDQDALRKRLAHLLGQESLQTDGKQALCGSYRAFLPHALDGQGAVEQLLQELAGFSAWFQDGNAPEEIAAAYLREKLAEKDEESRRTLLEAYQEVLSRIWAQTDLQRAEQAAAEDRAVLYDRAGEADAAAWEAVSLYTMSKDPSLARGMGREAPLRQFALAAACEQSRQWTAQALEEGDVGGEHAVWREERAAAVRNARMAAVIVLGGYLAKGLESAVRGAVEAVACTNRLHADFAAEAAQMLTLGDIWPAQLELALPEVPKVETKKQTHGRETWQTEQTTSEQTPVPMEEGEWI